MRDMKYYSDEKNLIMVIFLGKRYNVEMGASLPSILHLVRYSDKRTVFLIKQ